MRFKKENIPNYITLFRLFLVPVYIIVFFWDYPTTMIYSGIIYIVAGISDVIDGYLARKNNWVSNIGKLFDPLADKLMAIAALVCLVIKERITVWIVAILLLKEIVMILGAAFILKKGKVYVKSSWYGKAATVALFLLVFTVSFFPGIEKAAIDIMCNFVIAIMVYAFVMYFIEYCAEIKKNVRAMSKNKSTVNEKSDNN